MSNDSSTRATTPMDDSTKPSDASQAMVGEKDSVNASATLVETSIHPENEVVGARLLLIHVGITVSAFLAGLVGEL